MGYVRRLTGYALRHRSLFIAVFVGAGVGTIFNVLTPTVLVTIVDTIIPSGDYGFVLPYALFYVSLSALYAFFDTAGRYAASLTAQNVIYNLRRELYDSLMEKDLAFYDKEETGDLLARVSTDVTTMREFLFWGYRVIFIGTATIIGTYIVMWTISPQLTLYLLLLVPLIAAFVTLFAKRVRPIFYAARDQYGVLSSVLAENVVGQKVIQSYAAGERELARVEKENRAFLELRTQALRLLSFYRPLLPALFGIVLGALVYIGGFSFILGDLSYGEFVGFASLVGMMILPARFLTWGLGMYQRASAAGERTFYILDHRDELINPENPVPFSGLEGRVEFDHVDFSYRGDKWILRDVNLLVEPGQIVALLGGTGSGKTSLINLIPRFYDADSLGNVCYKGKMYRINESGRVRIEGKEYYVKDNMIVVDGEEYPVKHPGFVLVDNIDVRDCDLDDLRGSIGIVHQDPFLFSASIRENIAFGKPDATLEEVETAAKAAMIHDFVMTLDEGYDSIVGERGVTLSGGQKQRVAIARALLADPKILILDDSTSSVDAKTELLIQQALKNLMAGRTTFIITHRLSTIRNADLIVMMDRGRISEMGTHEELLENGGLYSDIYATLSDMEAVATASATLAGGGNSE